MRNLAIVMGWAWLSLGNALAEDNQYSIRMNSIFIGKLTFSHEFEDGHYQAQIAAETIGFAKAIILASIDGEVEGEGEKFRQYFPTQALIDVKTPEYQDEIKYEFENKFLTLYERNFEPEITIDYTEYEEAVDPVTGFTYVARSINAANVCQMRFLINDGEHILRLVLRNPETRQDGRIQCEGGLERLEGYSEEDKEETPFYKLVGVYAQESQETYRLDWLVADTPWGTIEMAYQY